MRIDEKLLSDCFSVGPTHMVACRHLVGQHNGHCTLNGGNDQPGDFLLDHVGCVKGITAAAHKLARIIYSMLRYGHGYVDAGAEYYESQYRQRVLHSANRRAAQLGYALVPIAELGEAQQVPTPLL